MAVQGTHTPPSDSSRGGDGDELTASGGTGSLLPETLLQHIRPHVPGYRLLQRIGDGGQAVVYLAKPDSADRKVAVKVLRDGPLADENSRERHRREIRALSNLDHPNIVRILDSGVTPDGHEFLVTEYIEGRSLDQFMLDTRSGGKSTTDPAALLRLFMTICDAVNAAHRQGITHRDLSPSNVRIDNRGQPYVLDFGLSRTAFDQLMNPGAGAVSITGQFLGKLAWASPEQARGDPKKIDIRTDVYALGIILYQIITGGRFPYVVVGDYHEVLKNIVDAKPTPPSELIDAKTATEIQSRRRVRKQHPPLVNSAIEEIVLKALEKKPDDRYQTAGELCRDVESYLAGRPTVASLRFAPAIGLSMPDRFREVRRSPLLWLLLGLAAAAVFLLIAFPSIRFWQPQHTAQPREQVLVVPPVVVPGPPTGPADLPSPAAAVAPGREAVAPPVVWSLEQPLRDVVLGPLPHDDADPLHPVFRSWMNTSDNAGRAEISAVADADSPPGPHSSRRALQLTYPASGPVGDGYYARAGCLYRFDPGHSFTEAPYLVLSAKVFMNCDRYDTRLRYFAGCIVHAGGSRLIGFNFDCWVDPVLDSHTRADLPPFVVFDGVQDSPVIRTASFPLRWNQWRRVAIAVDCLNDRYLWVAVSGYAPLDLQGQKSLPLAAKDKAPSSYEIEIFLKDYRDEHESRVPTELFRVTDLKLVATKTAPPLPLTSESERQ